MSGDKSSRQKHRSHSSSSATASGAACDTKLPSLSPPQFATGYEVSLPPSIPISLDGEEGAYAYNQQLSHINAEAKPECYQPPPNITIRRRLSGGCEDVLGASFHSSYTSVTSTPKSRSAMHQRSERLYTSDTESSSGRFASPRKSAPLPEIPRRSSRDGDYVGSSLSTWRPAMESPEAALVPSRHHQPRSSSADSARKLTKLKRFFTKKFGGRVPLLKPEPLASHPSVEAAGPLYDKFEGDKGLGKGISESPWDLPPNYVDMIFTKDPVTQENQSEVVETSTKFDIRKV